MFATLYHRYYSYIAARLRVTRRGARNFDNFYRTGLMCVCVWRRTFFCEVGLVGGPSWQCAVVSTNFGMALVRHGVCRGERACDLCNHTVTSDMQGLVIV